MDKLIEEYKEELKNDDGGYPQGLKRKILKDLGSDNFSIPVNKVNEMLKIARKERVTEDE